MSNQTKWYHIKGNDFEIDQVCFVSEIFLVEGDHAEFEVGLKCGGLFNAKFNIVKHGITYLKECKKAREILLKKCKAL